MTEGIQRVDLKNVLDAEGRRADHWLNVRPMSGKDMIALSSVEEDLGGLITRMGAAVVAHDFLTKDGEPADILDQPWATLKKMLTGWRSGSEEDALPQP